MTISIDLKQLKKDYTVGGLVAVVDALEIENNDNLKPLLRVAQTQEDVAMDNFNRGRWSAIEDIIGILRSL